jgi:phage gp29-like protein
MSKRQLDKHIAQLTYSQVQKFLPDPDKVLQKAGKGLEAYRDLMIDGHLFSVRQQRELKLQSMLWELYKEDTPDPIYELVNDCLKRIKIYDLLKYIMEARFMGTSIIEIIWKQKNGYWVPFQLEPKPIEWFRLKTDLSWRMYLPNLGSQNIFEDGVELPDYKFLIVQNGANPLEPYGDKILKRCFWPVTFKRGGVKFWAKFTEKFGMAQLIGKLPPGSTDEKISTLLTFLENMFEDSVAVIPSDGSIEAMNPNTSANSDNYGKFLSYLENEISKVVLTETLTTQLGDSGSYAATESHAGILGDLAKTDAQFVSEAIDTLIRYIVELNFSTVPDDLPKFVMYFEEQIDKVLADRDKVLSDMGVKFKKNYFARAYNLQEDEFEIEGDNVPQQPSAFADVAGDGGNEDPLKSLSASLINAAVSAIEEFSSFAELLDNLDKLYSALDATKIREALAKEGFVAQIKGSADANG